VPQHANWFRRFKDVNGKRSDHSGVVLAQPVKLVYDVVEKKHNKSSAVAEMGDRGHNRYGPKRGGGAAVPLSRELGHPSNTRWPGQRSISVPSGVFIHPAVWPQ